MTDLIGVYNHDTGEEIVREMTSAEKTQRDFEITAFLAQEEKLKVEAKMLYEVKISAYKKLGLTDAEIEALVPAPKPDIQPILGGN
jgi:hypothetical protein